MAHDHSIRRKYLIVGLLFVYMVINFADKAVLGIVAIPMMRDLGLSPADFGMLASSFFVLYSVSGIVFGFVSNRVSTKVLLAILAMTWAVTQFPIAWWSSLPVLIACRVILGVGEGPAYPVAIHAAYKWFPNERRNLPTALISQGAPVGVVLAAPLLSYVLSAYSWRAAFVLLGVVGAVWVLAWLLWGAEGPIKDVPAACGVTADDTTASYSTLILDRTVLGTIIATFAAYWILAMGLTWLPPYLQKGLGYDVVSAGWLVSVIVGANIPLQLGGSWVSEWLLRRGISSRVARGYVMNGLIVAGGACILLAMTDGAGIIERIVLLALGCALPNIAFCIGPAIIGEVTPSAKRGALLAINSSIATMAGLIAPWVTGWLVQRGASAASGYANGYLLAGAILVCGGVLSLFLVNPESTRAARAGATEARSGFGWAGRQRT